MKSGTRIVYQNTLQLALLILLAVVFQIVSSSARTQHQPRYDVVCSGRRKTKQRPRPELASLSRRGLPAKEDDQMPPSLHCNVGGFNKDNCPKRKDLSCLEWCNKTTHQDLCTSTVRSDPRDSLKSDPHGLVVILVSAAKANANTTTSFIRDTLKNQSTTYDYPKAKEVMKECLASYSLDWVGTALSVDLGQVTDRKRCIDVNDALRNAAGEVSYDCERDLPSPRTALLAQMYECVEVFASIVDSARQILSFIDCGEL